MYNKRIKWMATSLLLLLLIVFGTNYYLHSDVIYFLKPSLDDDIPRMSVRSDLDEDGLNDLDDILEGAHKEIDKKTKYLSVYYDGGYPPDSEGVCTDVIWRAMANAGYNIKDEIDKDIMSHPEAYPRVDKADPNIDFRRVVNLNVFMKKYLNSYTFDVTPYDVDNLVEWQAGDIVILEKPSHIGIISDKRRKDGVPYVLHNASKHASEDDVLLKWYEAGKIIGHYRLILK